MMQIGSIAACEARRGQRLHSESVAGLIGSLASIECGLISGEINRETSHMRVLIVWDDPGELRIIQQFLTAAQHQAEGLTDFERLAEFLQESPDWDIVLMAIGHPDFDESFEQFCHLRILLPDRPVVGASRVDEVFRSARFLTEGLRQHIVRDPAGDFIFLLTATLESTLEATLAERASLLSERIASELSGLRDVQTQLQPANLPCLDQYLTAARHEPAEYLLNGMTPQLLPGGDFYHVARTGPDQLTLILGDCGGHGLKAALSLIALRAAFEHLDDGRGDHPSAVVSRINLWLCQHAQLYDDGGLISLFCGRLNLIDGTLEWTSAGHPIPLLQDLTTQEIIPIGMLDESAMPVGIVEESEYEGHTTQLKPGQRLLIYSDGLEDIYPATGDDPPAFGTEGLCRWLTETRSIPPSVALQRLFELTLAYTGGEPRGADATAILLERLFETP